MLSKRSGGCVLVGLGAVCARACACGVLDAGRPGAARGRHGRCEAHVLREREGMRVGRVSVGELRVRRDEGRDGGRGRLAGAATAALGRHDGRRRHGFARGEARVKSAPTSRRRTCAKRAQ